MAPMRKKLRPSTKQDVISMIRRMPDEASLEDIMYALYVRETIDRGLRDIDEGNIVSHEEVKEKLAKWLQSPGPEEGSEV